MILLRGHRFNSRKPVHDHAGIHLQYPRDDASVASVAGNQVTAVGGLGHRHRQCIGQDLGGDLNTFVGHLDWVSNRKHFEIFGIVSC